MRPKEGLTGSVKILAACGRGLPVVPPLLFLLALEKELEAAE